MARCPNYVSKRVYQDLAKKLNQIQEDLGFGALKTNDGKLWFDYACCSLWYLGQDKEGVWGVVRATKDDIVWKDH